METFKSPVGVLVGKDNIPIEMSIVRNEMSQMGFSDVQKIVKALQGNRHCQITTCYYLVLKKKLRNGVHLKADINSNSFDSSLLNHEFAPKFESLRSSLAESHFSKGESLLEKNSTEKEILKPQNSDGPANTPKSKMSQAINSNSSTTSGGAIRNSSHFHSQNAKESKGSPNDLTQRDSGSRRGVKRPAPLSRIFDSETEKNEKKLNEPSIFRETKPESLSASGNGSSEKTKRNPEDSEQKSKNVFEKMEEYQNQSSKLKTETLKPNNERLKMMLQAQTPLKSVVTKETPRVSGSRRENSLGNPEARNQKNSPVLNERRRSLRINQNHPSPKMSMAAQATNESTISKRVHNITDTSQVSNNTTGINSSFNSRSISPAKNSSQRPQIAINAPEPISKGLRVAEILKTPSPAISFVNNPYAASRNNQNGAKLRQGSANKSSISPKEINRMGGTRQDVLKSFIQGKVNQNHTMEIPRAYQGGFQSPNKIISGKYNGNLTMESVKREMIRKMGLDNPGDFGDSSLAPQSVKHEAMSVLRVYPGGQSWDRKEITAKAPATSTPTPTTSVFSSTATPSFNSKLKPFKITKRPSIDVQGSQNGGILSGNFSAVYSRTSGQNTPTQKPLNRHF